MNASTRGTLLAKIYYKTKIFGTGDEKCEKCIKKKKKKRKEKKKVRIQFPQIMPKLTFCQHSTDAKCLKNATNVIIFQVIWGVWPLVSPPPPPPAHAYGLTETDDVEKTVSYLFLSYDVAVIQWLTSCHKNRMTTRYITLGYWRVTSWCCPWQRYVFCWNNDNFKGDKIPF